METINDLFDANERLSDRCHDLEIQISEWRRRAWFVLFWYVVTTICLAICLAIVAAKESH